MNFLVMCTQNVSVCCLLNLHFRLKISSSVSYSRGEWLEDFWPKEPWEQADLSRCFHYKFPSLFVTFFSPHLYLPIPRSFWPACFELLFIMPLGKGWKKTVEDIASVYDIKEKLGA